MGKKEVGIELTAGGATRRASDGHWQSHPASATPIVSISSAYGGRLSLVTFNGINCESLASSIWWWCGISRKVDLADAAASDSVADDNLGTSSFSWDYRVMLTCSSLVDIGGVTRRRSRVGSKRSLNSSSRKVDS